VGISILGGAGAGWAVVRGLSSHLADRWLARYKNDLDKELEGYKDTLENKRKKLEAEVGHRTYISKTQFDTEFNALKECFGHLGKLRLAFNGLRPCLDWLPPEEDDRMKVLRARLELFAEHYNAFVASTESLYPFIPADIDEEFNKCGESSDAGAEAHWRKPVRGVFARRLRTRPEAT
jgi:hypothetical protein